MLAIIETHPIQYRAPVYRTLSRQLGIPITVIYGSDFSVVGYQDKEFKTKFAWDTDLLSGYSSLFLSHVKAGGASCFDEVTARGLWQALCKVSPKAILITGYSHKIYQAAFYHAWKLKCPLLLRAETTDHTLVRSTVKTHLRNQVLSWFYKNCYKLLYIGQHSKMHFHRLGCPENKLIFSPYCVDTSAFDPDETARIRYRSNIRQNLGITEANIVLLLSGKLIHKKGPDLLLQAVQELPAEIRNRIVIMFLGDGEVKESLQSQASQLNLTVHFLGFQNQSYLSRYYHAADLLVLPSRYAETWGLVVNEALHHGLPCVVSQGVGCAPDLVQPGVTGNLFETNSIQSLAQAIQHSLILVNRAEIREKCRQKVSGYSVLKASEGIARAYREVALL